MFFFPQPALVAVSDLTLFIRATIQLSLLF
jgi:hypothetical protein